MLVPYAGQEFGQQWRTPAQGWRNYSHKCPSDQISRRQEEILSYFIGLGPVGTMVEIDRKTLYRDCGFNNQQTYYQAINALIHGGYIRRLAGGSGGSTGLIVVINRGHL